MSVPASARPSRMRAALAVLGVVAAGCADDGGGDAAPTTRAAARSSTTTTEDRSDAAPETVTVFRSGEGGYASYRIPAIVANADGDLIAFAEGRVGSAADDGDVDLVSRRSADDGRSWGPVQLVAEDGANFVGNPSPVLDVASGRLVLLATHKAGTDTEVAILTGTGADTSRELLLTSDDGGNTWSAPLDVTASVKQPDWRWYAVGPGHAIQLRTGPHAGRLVAAANHSDAGVNSGAHVLMSDDGGRTWRIGAVDTPQGGTRHPDETAGAELADGTLVFSSRDQGGADGWHRLRATSSDGGTSFDAPFEDQAGLVVPVVEASLLSWWGEGRGDGVLLLSAPSDADQRVDLRIRTSRDAGSTWSAGLLVAAGPAAYSDLVGLPGGRVGVLVETGATGPNERIDFTAVGIDRVLAT